jgi:hypothetical protein
MVYINVESVKNRWRKTSKDNYIWFSDLPLVQNSCSKTGKIYACFLCHCFNWKMTFDVNFYPMHQVKFINFINNMYIVNTLPKRYRSWRVRDTDRGDWEIQTVATDLQRQLNNTKCVITGTGGDNRHDTSLKEQPLVRNTHWLLPNDQPTEVRRGRDRGVIGLTTTCAISAYHY